MSDDIRQLVGQLLATSRYAIPLDEARRHIKERRARLLAAPPVAEPDLAPEPMPILDDPIGFAAKFIADREGPDKPRPPTKPKNPRGRRPTGDLGPKHDRFRVIDGDGDKPKP